MALLFFFAPFVWAQPQLTTIDDIIYRADGEKFEGTALIEWRNFTLSDFTTVAAYSKAVRIVNGSLRIGLAPTTNASVGSHYQVRYLNRNGRLMFLEYWGVPPSTSILKINDVRLAGPPMPQDQGGGGGGGSPDPVAIPDVTGLAEELNARAKKGLGYQPSSVAVINSTGDLESAVGEPTDCVRVNGTTGPCSAESGPAFVDGEVPAGLTNGTNTTFTLANAPDPASSLRLFRNGLLQSAGVDYTLSGNIITFLTGALPQTGDLLASSYRLPGASGQIGAITGSQAGGALTGYFPAPSIAAGAISDQHVASNAAIAESKLALNFATHSNSNDPSADQKAALAGTTGTPAGGNRYVTNQDPRLTDARTPSAHPLLASNHSDVAAGTVARGDLIVGMGTAPAAWTKLALGAVNRCLTSNGFDAVWNACLFTGFPAGAVPFVDASGNLAHNQSRLNWDNAARRLAIGTGTAASTLTVHDASAGDGVTTVSVRAGANQQTAPMQRWQNASAADLARVESDGTVMAAAVQATSTASRAAWQETGTASDPSSPAPGSAWFNSTESTRKTREALQNHSVPQVICSVAGTATSSSTMTTLGSCTVPSSLLRPGDRLEIRADMSHEGSSTAFSFLLNWGSVFLTARSGLGSESWMSVRSEVFPASGAMQWSWQSWGNSSDVIGGGGVSSNPPSGNVLVELKGQMSTTTADTVTLRNLTIVRLPAQANP
ncbi:MAG: hypothetical protein JNK48_08710 [Bryobacterales bacterium]|nr:hypothetical protein [Bryobacterales bacterium]